MEDSLEQRVIALEKENAELKRQLEERQKKSTCNLVEELGQRVGVDKITVAPYETINLEIEDQKVLLAIED